MSDASDSPAAVVDSPADSSPAENGGRSEASADPSSEDDVATQKSKRVVTADELDSVEGDKLDEDEDDEAGLFGEDSGDELDSSRQKRTLDDAELDSGDDVGRRDRLDDSDQEVEQKVINTVDISLGRHAVPRSTDGELYLLRNAQSTGIDHRAFDPTTFKPPTSSHHGAPPLKGFSAAHTADTTIRWRRDPDNPKHLQSNSRIIRWSDGSLTLQIGSNPLEQLELPAKSLAPPQHNSRIPLPTSSKQVNGKAYDSKMDAHTYLASVHQDAQFIRLTNHVTASLTVQTTIEDNDDALIRLQESMAAASKNYARADQNSGPAIMKNLEDPELAKRKAEAAEKEKLRAERRRLNQEQRMRERQDRVYGRVPRIGASGLTVGGLEDGISGRSRPKAIRKPRRRGSEYSDDEDDFRRGKTKEDEYDEDDGFLVGSDEDPEIVDDDDDEEEEVLGEDADADGDKDMPAPPPRSPKRPREEETDGGGGGGGKRGKRMVLEDEDDEDE